MNVWKSQWSLLKKRRRMLLFLLILPLLGTYIFLHFVTTNKEDWSIPIAYIDDDRSNYSKQLLKDLQREELLNIRVMEDEREAEQLLLARKVDSVWVIKKGFGEGVQKERLSQTIVTKRTSQSFGYFPAKELILSSVNEAASTVHAVTVIQKEVNVSIDASFVEKVLNERKKKRTLLEVAYHQKEEVSEVDEVPLIVWSILALWSTVFSFRLIRLQREGPLSLRLVFYRMTTFRYLLVGVVLLSMMMVGMDLLANSLFSLNLSFLQLFSYRLALSLGAFILVLYTTSVSSYDRWGFLFSILFTVSALMFHFLVTQKAIISMHPLLALWQGVLPILFIGGMSGLLVFKGRD